MDLPVCISKQSRFPAPLPPGEWTVSSSFDVKEQVRQAIDIVDLVGQYLQLRRQGRNYVALCPWHDDSRPSLQVNPERQSFKCWVCDVGGDVFSFLMRIEGIEFREALEMLADRANIPLRPQQPRRGAGSAGGDEPLDKRTLFAAMAWAENLYHDCLLRAPAAEPARRYLQQRRITPESLERFHLGFAPAEWNWLQSRAAKSPFDMKTLEAVGLVARSASGKLYDRFRGRVLFSIRDTQSRPIAFGGRVLPEMTSENAAKYVNSPETPLFTKSKHLYALDVARDALRRSKTALVMEGYTDCIVAHQQGFEDAVAVLGTALGENHVRLLRGFADRIVLVLDGDEAGQRRANEVLELFVAEQVDLRILTLPGGTDPCDYLLEHGAAAFAALLEREAVDALEHAFRAHTRGIDLARDIHAASEALERLVAIVARAPRLHDDTTAEARFREQKVLQRLAATFRMPEEDVRRRLTELRRRPRGRRAPVPETAPSRGPSAEKAAAPAPIPPWERELLELLLARPEMVGRAAGAVAAEQLSAPPCRRIYETACRLTAAGIMPDFDRLMLEFDQADIKNLLVELDERGRAKGTDAGNSELILKEILRTRQRYEAEKRSPAAIAALRDGELDERQQHALLQQLIEHARSRQDRTDPTDG